MAYIYDLTDTWSAGGTAFNAIKMNVTDSASAAGSKLITLQTNGAEHFSVSKAGVGYFSGNVGAGISSPTSKLHVVGATTSLAQFTGPEYSQIRHSDGTRTLYTQVYDNLGVLGTESSTPIAFATANTEKMRITVGGNVGIGTQTPAELLQIQKNTGTSGFENGFLLTNGVDANLFNYVTGTAATDKRALITVGAANQSLTFGTLYTERMRITASGVVGIGTTAPTGYATKLAVVGGNFGLSEDGATVTSINANANVSSIGAYHSTGASLTLGTSPSGSGTTERMRITSAGNVGIGTTTPSNRFVVSNAGANGFEFNTTDNIVQTYNRATSLYTDFNLYSLNHRIFTGTSPTEKMRVDSNGFVGIGTTTPGYKLEVRTDGASDFNWVTSFNNTAAGGYGAGFVARAGSNFGYFYMRGDGTAYVENAGANPLAFATNGTEKMRIESGGNVAIGTTAPNSKFVVTYSNPTSVPAAGAGGHCAAFGTVGYGLAAGAITNGNAYLQATRWDTLATNYDLMLQPNGGNVGIGTNAPAAKLHVAGSGVFGEAISSGAGVSTNDISMELGGFRTGNGNCYVDLHATASTDFESRLIRAPGVNGEFNILNTGTGPFSITQTGAAELVFKTSNNERARIDSSGNLLWGKTSLSNETTTDGAILYKNASGGGSTAYFTNGGTGTVMAVSTQGDTGAVIFFRSGTSVGSISVTSSATAYNTSSDYRLKDIDGPISNSGAYIDALKPVQGSWRADGSRFIGLLAHEVQEVSETPIATGEKDGEEMQAMDYSAPEIIANLIAEIQSLRARVAQLEGN